MIGIYHNRDLDGISSAAIMKARFPQIELIGWDYGDPLEIPRLNEPIIMADVSLPMPKMHELAQKSGFQLTWIDHHKSAIRDYEEFVGDYEGFLFPVLKEGTGACELTWRHLFHTRPPEAIRLLSAYDTWQNDDEEYWEEVVLPFQYGMRGRCSSPDTFPEQAIKPSMVNEIWLSDVIEDGKAILKYQEFQDSMNARKGAFEAVFKDLRAICMNGGGFNSNSFKSVYDPEKHDLMMPFKFDGKKWVVSLYTDKDIDCSVLAKSMGGGGHMKAAGFEVKSFNDIGLHIL